MALDRPPPMPLVPRPRRRWISVLLVILVFLGGFVTGGGTVLRLIQVRVRETIAHPEREAARQVADLKKQLGLTPDQTRQIEALYTSRITSIVQNGRGQIDLLNEEILRVLDEPQRLRWQKLRGQRTDPWLPKKPPPADNGEKSTPST